MWMFVYIVTVLGNGRIELGLNWGDLNQLRFELILEIILPNNSVYSPRKKRFELTSKSDIHKVTCPTSLLSHTVLFVNKLKPKQHGISGTDLGKPTDTTYHKLIDPKIDRLVPVQISSMQGSFGVHVLYHKLYMLIVEISPTLCVLRKDYHGAPVSQYSIYNVYMYKYATRGWCFWMYRNFASVMSYMVKYYRHFLPRTLTRLHTISDVFLSLLILRTAIGYTCSWCVCNVEGTDTGWL